MSVAGTRESCYGETPQSSPLSPLGASKISRLLDFGQRIEQPQKRERAVDAQQRVKGSAFERGV